MTKKDKAVDAEALLRILWQATLNTCHPDRNPINLTDSDWKEQIKMYNQKYGAKDEKQAY